MTDVFIKKGNLDTDMDIRRMPYEGEAETKPRDTKDIWSLQRPGRGSL